MAVTTLAQYYSGKGQALPSLQQRGQLYQQYGLGTGYQGTAQQNTSLLQKLLGGQTQPTTGGQQLGPALPSNQTQSGGVNIVNGQIVPVGGSPTIGNTGVPMMVNQNGMIGTPGQIDQTKVLPQGTTISQNPYGIGNTNAQTNPVAQTNTTSTPNKGGLTFTVDGKTMYSPSGNKYDAIPVADQGTSNVSDIMGSIGKETGTDTYGLDTKSTDELTAIIDAINKQSTQNQPNYTDILNQARTTQGVPGLQQNVIDILSQLQQTTAAQRQAFYEPQINGMTGGVLQSGVAAAQQAVQGGQNPEALRNILQSQSLAEQGNLAQNRLNYAQQNVAQSLGAAEAQGSLGIQQGQLVLSQQQQEAMLPYQQALTAAQAQQATAQAGFYQSIYGGLTSNPSNAVQGTGASQLPSYVQGAMSTDINGQGYIVESRIPSLGGMGLDAAKAYAGKAGVPLLNDAQAASIAGLDVTQNNLKDLQSKIGDLLGSGLGGTIQGHTLNQIEQMLGIGNGPALQQINSFREAAIKQIQGLASGGSGLRINQAEIDSAIKNLPTTSDNIETAKAKLEQVGIFFANQRAAMYALGGLRAATTPVGGDTFSAGW